MSYVNIYVHLVWGTKYRQKILIGEKKLILISHIKENAIRQGIEIIEINGHSDHLHCILKLKPDQTISRVAQMIKGESSHWANTNNLFGSKLIWAKKYYAEALDKSNLPRIRNYISNQVNHHRKQTFTEKYLAFLKENDF
jgi:REP element-mobilizing transposase RayT